MTTTLDPMAMRDRDGKKIVWDPACAADVEALEADVARIAEAMDDPDPEVAPAMYWSGIPWPPPGPEPSCDYQLVVSLGGTKTDFALLRLDRGVVVGLDVTTGQELSDPKEIDEVKKRTQMPTPPHGPKTPTGQDMVRQIVANLVPHIERQRKAFERCEAVYLSWGFPHKVIRTGDRIAGGLAAKVTLMTKAQAPFTDSLLGCDIGELFGSELEKQAGWRRPVAVANDTVMALHWFLDPRCRAGHARVGLLINGTGTNFSAAEPYAIGRAGFVSKGTEYIIPDRVTPGRPLRPGEKEALFFVNYEAGGIPLVATKTAFDTEKAYPIERNALAGGNAFRQQLEAYIAKFVSADAYATLAANWKPFAKDEDDRDPAGPAVSMLLSEKSGLLTKGLDPTSAASVRAIAGAIADRSAMHAALVLAAVTGRTGFGLGRDGEPDILGMEGSVWRTPGYPDGVRRWWETLVGKKLSVDFLHEPNFNASLTGPVFMAAIHR